LVEHDQAKTNEAKLPGQTMAWNSLKSFWIGVPDRMILRGVRRALNIAVVLLFADFSL
jgi:hypothetical protein